MIGAIIGDIVGSRFEFHNTKSKNFKLFHEDCDFTDDTIHTLAVALSLTEYKLNGGDLRDITRNNLKNLSRRYPHAGYGGMFYRWMISSSLEPYNSYGNGAAMRISPVGDVAETIEEAKKLSYLVTSVTHNHPEGLKGAEAVAVATVLVKQHKSKEEIRTYMEENYYPTILGFKEYHDRIRGHGEEICQVSVPQALGCFFDSDSFEDCIRNAIAIGGDSDTIAAIAGGIAEHYYGVPESLEKKAFMFLFPNHREIVREFRKAYNL